MKLFTLGMTVLLLLFCLAGCTQETAATQPQETAAPAEPTETLADERETMEKVEMVVSENTIGELEFYPNLKEADLSGSTCYTAIVVYAKNHPEVKVTYTIDLGGMEVDSRVEAVSPADDMVTFENLKRNLVYLTELTALHLPGTSLTLEELTELRETYPDVSITYTVMVNGQELLPDAEAVDLSGLSSEQVAQTCPALLKLPNLKAVELMGEDGSCRLSRQDVKLLVDTAPGVKFHYVFQLFGRDVSTTDETIHFKNLSLSEADEGTIREAMDILTSGSTLILERCGLDSEFLASIREDYPDKDLAWRVYFGVDGRYSCLTNTETIRAVYNVTNSTCGPLKYCRSVKYMDLGHNATLSDLSFVGYMPELEILIASESGVTDLTGFENCKNLEFLELAYCGYLKDLTPLSGCTGLKYLNICYTKVTSLMPLDGLELEVLFCKKTPVSADEQKQFKELHEGCNATFTGSQPYAGPGWRYVDNGYTFTEIYKKVRQVFNLDAVDKLIQAGAK